MANSWAVLLLVGLTMVVNIIAVSNTLTYDEAVAMALKDYNKDLDPGEALFRLLSATPPSSRAENKFPLKFRIKETVCRRVRRRRQDPEECPFKENGVEKECTGIFHKTWNSHFSLLSCSRLNVDFEEMANPTQQKSTWE